MTCIEPDAPPLFAVMVTVPWLPTICPWLEFDDDTLMMLALLVVKVVVLVTSEPFCVAVKMIAVPAGSVARLTFVPRDD